MTPKYRTAIHAAIVSQFAGELKTFAESMPDVMGMYTQKPTQELMESLRHDLLRALNAHAYMETVLLLMLASMSGLTLEDLKLGEVYTDKTRPHLLDVYSSLGIRWGDDPFPRIKDLMEKAHLYEKDRDVDVHVRVCCGDFEDCEKACKPRADYWKAKAQSNGTPLANPGDAIQLLRNALINDPAYLWTWHCNVAMAFQDEGGYYEQSNKAAARFLSILFGVDTTQLPEYKSVEKVWSGKSAPVPPPSQPKNMEVVSYAGGASPGGMYSTITVWIEGKPVRYIRDPEERDLPVVTMATLDAKHEYSNDLFSMTRLGDHFYASVCRADKSALVTGVGGTESEALANLKGSILKAISRSTPEPVLKCCNTPETCFNELCEHQRNHADMVDRGLELSDGCDPMKDIARGLLDPVGGADQKFPPVEGFVPEPWALQLAATAWCGKDSQHSTMDVAVATEFARILMQQWSYYEADVAAQKGG